MTIADKGWRFYGVLAVFIAAQAYLLPKILLDQDGLDFRLIWLAGRLWLAGSDPYGSAFATEYLKTFGEGPVSHFWVYPPNWWAISATLALMKFETALRVWNIVNYLCMAAASWLTFPRSPARFLLLFGFVATMQDTSVAIALGQTAMIVFLGVASFCYGWRRRSAVAVFAGLVLLSLKPNIGLPFLVAAAASAGMLRPAIAAAAVALVAALPVMSAETITGFVRSVGRYSAPGLIANGPPNMTGLLQIASLFGITIPAMLLTAIAAAGAAFLVRRSLPLAVATIAILVPLHAYDLAFVLCLAPYLSRATAPVAIGFALLWRSSNVASVTGVMHPEGQMFAGTLIATLGLCVVLAGFAWGLRNRDAGRVAPTGSVFGREEMPGG